MNEAEYLMKNYGDRGGCFKPFDNFIRRRLSDHKKITFVIKYLPMSHLR